MKSFDIKERVSDVGTQYLELCAVCLRGVNNLPLPLKFSYTYWMLPNSETQGETRIYVDEVRQKSITSTLA